MNETRKREAEAMRLALAELSGEKVTIDQKKEIAWLKIQWFEEMARALPKKYYIDMSKRQHVIIDRQAKIWGLPLDQPILDLYDIVKSFHDFLAENSNALLKARKNTDTHSIKQQAETRMLEIKIKHAELELQDRAGKLIDREAVRNCFTWLAQQFKEMSEQIGRSHGPGPQQQINHFLDRMLKELSNGTLSV